MMRKAVGKWLGLDVLFENQKQTAAQLNFVDGQVDRILEHVAEIRRVNSALHAEITVLAKRFNEFEQASVKARRQVNGL